MLPKADEAKTQLSKYLAWKDEAEAKPIPNKETLEKEEKFDENDPYNNKETLTNTVETDDSEW